MIDTVARCPTCGSYYSSRAWPWLEPVDHGGAARLCPVPGCATKIVRGGVSRACGCVAQNDNDAQPER